MTASGIATVLTAIAVVLGQVAAIILAWRGMARSKVNGEKLDSNREALEAQSARIEEIHAQTGVLTGIKISKEG